MKIYRYSVAVFNVWVFFLFLLLCLAFFPMLVQILAGMCMGVFSSAFSTNVHLPWRYNVEKKNDKAIINSNGILVLNGIRCGSINRIWIDVIFWYSTQAFPLHGKRRNKINDNNNQKLTPETQENNINKRILGKLETRFYNTDWLVAVARRWYFNFFF